MLVKQASWLTHPLYPSTQQTFHAFMYVADLDMVMHNSHLPIPQVAPTELHVYDATQC